MTPTLLTALPIAIAVAHGAPHKLVAPVGMASIMAADIPERTHKPAMVPAALAAVATSVVRIDANCSGVFVGPTTILTAAHCVTRVDLLPSDGTTKLGAPSKESFEISRAKAFGESVEVIGAATVLSSDRALDVALMSFSPTDDDLVCQPVAIDTEVAMNEVVFGAGFPRGFHQLSVAEGKVTQVISAADGTPSAIVSDVLLSGGNSGGPLFNIAGKLVGWSTARTWIDLERGTALSEARAISPLAAISADGVPEVALPESYRGPIALTSGSWPITTSGERSDALGVEQFDFVLPAHVKSVSVTAETEDGTTAVRAYVFNQFSTSVGTHGTFDFRDPQPLLNLEVEQDLSVPWRTATITITVIEE